MMEGDVNASPGERPTAPGEITSLANHEGNVGNEHTSEQSHPPLADFHRLTRDTYLAAGDIGFWQGSLRDPLDDEFAQVRKAIDDRALMTVDLLYSDYEGGQRVISRFGLLPRQDGTWLPAPSRHWNLDRDDPR